MGNATSTVKNAPKTQPIVKTPPVVKTPTVATPPVVAIPVPVESAVMVFDGKLAVKLANEIKNAESETHAVTLGETKLNSTDQSNRKGKRGITEVTLIRTYKANDKTERYKVGDTDPDGKLIDIKSDYVGKLNKDGQANKARFDLLAREYDNPKESYDNAAIMAMVHNGIILRAANLIVKSYNGSGTADKVFGLNLVRRIKANWTIAERDSLYSELKQWSIDDDSLAMLDRETIESLADSTYSALAKMHGFKAIVKSSGKTVTTDAPTLADLLTIDMSTQVKSDKTENASQTPPTESDTTESADTVEPKTPYVPPSMTVDTSAKPTGATESATAPAPVKSDDKESKTDAK